MADPARFLITAGAVAVWTVAGLLLLGCIIGLVEAVTR